MVKHRRALSVGVCLLLSSSALVGASAAASGAGAPASRDLVARGTTRPVASVIAERGGGLRAGASLEGDAAGASKGPDRSRSTRGGRHTAGTTATTVTPAPAGQVGTSFRGLNLVENAQAAGFNLEPPDQGLCVGNGSVLELVNVVGRVYSTAGTPRTGPFYLNTFFKEDPDFANASDPSCTFDPDTGRFFADMLFYDSDRVTGELNGQNRIDIAVSDTGDPAGTWQVYSFDVTKDGAFDFNIGDYPQIGADAQGIYITTNSYPFFADGFNTAELYAMSKRGLAAGSDLRVTKVEVPRAQGGPAFTLRPTTSPGGRYATDANGTEHLLSSQAAEEAGNRQGFDQAISLWALSGTNSLAPGAARALTLSRDNVVVDRYGVPPLSDQKPGDYPLGQCLSESACRSAVFPTFGPASPHPLGPLDSSDSRMHQTVQVGGLVYGALDTVVNVGGQDRAGIAWYVVRPARSSGGVLKGTVVAQGKLALPGNNLSYPAFGADAAGRAVMAMNVVGRDHHPSAGYVTFDAAHRPSTVHLVGPGVGPQDGFTEYPEFSASGVPRPRWGDYAATAFDPETGSVWIASEYIDQTCSLATYRVDRTCGGTRTRFGNWATRVSEIRP